ncbi:endonuclease [Nonlabens xiamenensis]|uniref:endonuclease n=1 Tax=Nonlabens xiamenensis TaxID=2341043 RepID=UPI000F612B6C|nr:endonuclease [Nonlabens xiamenensis]
MRILLFSIAVIFAFAKAQSQVIINELDADTPGVDTAEFVELKTPSPFTSLNGYVMVLFNGSSSSTSGMGRSYFALDLDGAVTDANGLYVIGGNDVVPVPDRVFSQNTLQNGADAIAIYQGNATDWPDRTFATTVNLVDAVIYDTDDADNADLMNLLNISSQWNENENGLKTTESLQRKSDGTLEAKTPTPHSLNDAMSPTYTGVDFAISTSELNEPDTFNIVFSLTQSISSDFNLGFSLNNGNFNTADYTGATSFTIPAGQTSVNLSFSIVDDMIDEGDETMRINIGNNLPAGFKRIKDNQEVFVIDNDFQVAGYGTPLAPTYGNVASTAPTNYYNSLNGLSGAALEEAITAIIAEENVVRIHTYDDVTEILKDADVSPLNSNKVWLFYTEQERRIIDFQTTSDNTGKWNREHIYSRSRGGFFDIEYDRVNDGIAVWTETNADSLRHGQSDAHHLRAVDGPENSSRGNSDYPEYNGPSGSQGSWQGDVARALFYMDLRYNNLGLVNGNPPNTTVGQLGDLATLIQWHRNDPPDDFEMNRNNVIYTWQINRNPFIDLPDLAEYIYGNQIGQNYTLSEDRDSLNSVVVAPNPSNSYFFVRNILYPTQLAIYDMMGRLALQRDLDRDTNIIHDLAPGTYVIRLTAMDLSTTKKLIVQ